MEIFNILNELEELIETCPKVPMTSRVLVDEDKLLDYLDRIRTSLPEEVRQAKWVVQEREKVIADSKQEAIRIIQDAENELQTRAEESEVVKKAQEISEEHHQQAQEIASQIKQGAYQYADDILGELEDNLIKVLEGIRDGRNELKESK
ncbi:MAG: ATPase [Firmicutes bacterium]|nr:ATPase [Bacillota bacterium]